MTKKTTECYTAVFQYIESNVFHMEPSEIMTDFEAGMRKSIRHVYPDTILRGCCFHYCQALRNKIQKLGLRPLLKSCPEARLIFKEIMSLPLLPADKVLQGYLHIQNITKEYGIFQVFENFFSYFESFCFVEVMNQGKTF